MLTRELAIVEYKGTEAVPDRLTAKKHAHYLVYAQRMLDVYRQSLGLTRREIHRAIQRIFENEMECPPRRVDAFCKLLDEVSVYQHNDSTTAAKLRQKVFRAAAGMHPLVNEAHPWFEHDEQQAKQSIAAQLGMTWPELESKLFADIIEFHRLESFEGYDQPRMLLARYNLAQTQVALFDAMRMTIWATTDFKLILRYAKLARLMHTIERTASGYRFELNGPASLLCHTQRYGVAMAKFLPGLLACRGWRMQAQLRPARWRGYIHLSLDDQSGLSSQASKAEEFDSSVEQQFAERWGSEPRDGWTLTRESEIYHHGQTVFMPDFVLHHESGRRVMLEIVGFWTPEYLKHKQATLAQFSDHRILLVVSHQAEHVFEESANVVVYKTAIKINAILDWLKRGPGF